MTPDTTFLDPIQPYLEVNATQQTELWQQSQRFSTVASRWQGYLNQLCLATILPWLGEYDAQARTAVTTSALPSFWELVTGTPLIFGHRRLILIPTETLDLDEISIPQEWIDIPNWLGDWYLIAQVNPDDGWVRLVGSATHEQIKTQGQYRWQDRTYGLPEAAWITDWNVLWLSESLAVTASLRSTVSDLAMLTTVQANNLIARLGNAEVLVPRLGVPFAQWGPLVAHGGWRQQLAERRWGMPEQRSIQQWLQAGIAQLSQQLGWQTYELQSALSTARGERQETTTVFSRTLTLDGQPYSLTVSLADTDENTWRFELRPVAVGGNIPPGITLRLLTEDLQPFEGNEDTATTPVDCLYIEVSLTPGEGLVWETTPLPEDYDREILRF
jgi:hypothetical protein